MTRHTEPDTARLAAGTEHAAALTLYRSDDPGPVVVVLDALGVPLGSFKMERTTFIAGAVVKLLDQWGPLVAAVVFGIKHPEGSRCHVSIITCDSEGRCFEQEYNDHPAGFAARGRTTSGTPAGEMCRTSTLAAFATVAAR